MNTESHGDNYPSQELPKKEGVMRRIGQRVLRSLMPPAIVNPFNPNEYHFPSNAIADEEGAIDTELSGDLISNMPLEDITDTGVNPPSVVVTLSRDEQSIGFYNNANQQLHYPVTPEFSAPWIFSRFMRMYLATGGDKGSFSSDEIAKRTGYKHTTVVDTTRKLAEIMPSEVVTFTPQVEQNNLLVTFGDIGLASRLDDDHDDIPLPQLDFENRAAEIDRGKVDLTTYDHALITVKDEARYLPLESRDSITAARVIEALKLANLEIADSARVAAIAWGQMSVAERQLYVTNANHALSSDESRRIENDVLKVLRGLTNKLMLTHERHSDRFNVLVKPDDFLIRYSENSLKNNPQLKDGILTRPVIAPGERPIHKLSDQEKIAHVKDAARYIQITRAREKIDDETAIGMLDFIMSHEGRWALKEISGTPAGYKQHTTALKVMHKYLRRSMRGRGLYYDAYKQRLVNGNRKSRSGSGAQQVGGRLPGSTKWSIGRSMDEVLDHTLGEESKDQ